MAVNAEDSILPLYCDILPCILHIRIYTGNVSKVGLLWEGLQGLQL